MTHPFRTSFDRSLVLSLGCRPSLFTFLLTTLLMALTVPPRVQAQTAVHFAGSTPVGSTALPQPVTVSVQRAGTLGSVRVRTLGQDGFDFALLTGGTCQPGLVYVAGQTCTASVTFTPAAPGLRTGAVILLDPSGAPMGSTLLSANSTGSLQVFVPGTINTVAGTGTWLYNGDGGQGNQTPIFLPFGVAVDGAGNLFIADNGNNRIRRVDSVSGAISTVAGQGILGYGGDGGKATDALLSSPTGIAVDPTGNLYFTDSGNNIVRRIDAFTGLISTVVGVPSHNGYAGDGGAATSALLNAPNGIAFDASGNLFLADSGNHVIRRIDAVTGLISTVAGTGVAAYTGNGGPATAATLNSPWGVTVSAVGELYIADQGNHAIRKVDTSGVIQTLAGTGMAGYNDDNIPANTAQLASPAGVAVDVAGNIYVADSGNDRIRKINASTGIITSIAGAHGQQFFGDGGPADVAGLYGPYTVALDSTGSLLISDVFHNRIRRIASNAATLVYPAMRVGRVSSPMQQVLENDGNATLTVSSVDAKANSQADPVKTTCLPATALAELAQCTVSVSFAPTMTGALVHGTTLIQSNASNAPGTIDLQGQVLDTDPSTVTILSSNNPSQTGNAVTFSVTVTSAGLTPTGIVTLLDGTASIGSATLDKNGNATFSISTLTSGQHNLTASYAGDASNAPASSAVLVQVVKDPVAPTTTTLTAAVNPVVAGSGARFTVQVTPQVSGSGIGDITGSITLKDGAFIFGTYPLSGGVATFTESLTTGQHTLTAVYNGSNTYAPSTSPALSVTATIASSTLALSSATNPSVAGAPVTLSVAASSTGGIPTGTITFLDGANRLGTATLNPTGGASLTVPGSTWTVGIHSLTASYAGDVNDQPSVSPVFQQVVNIAQTTLLLGASANPVAQGGTVTFSATASGPSGIQAGTPTGTVQFFDGGSPLGSAALNASGIAMLSTSALTLGTHTITAQYMGDGNDTPSNSAALSELVQSASVSIQLSPASNPAFFADPLPLTAKVTGTGAQPTGSVQFMDGATILGSAPVDATGNASFSATGLTLGTHTLTAVYSGDKNHGQATSAAVLEHVLQNTTTSLSASTLHSIAGTRIQWTVTITGKAGQVPTGTVTIADNATTLTTLQLDGTGSATYASSAFSPGRHLLTAAYAGDTVSTSSTSPALNLIVDQATTSTTLTSSSNPANSGTPVILSVAVTGNGATPSGSITVFDGSTVVATASLQPNGTATVQTSTLSPGIHALTATYGGDINDAASTSAVLSQRIAQRTSVVLTSSGNPSLLADSITLTVTVGNGGTLAPSGMVTLTDGASAVGSATLNAGGVASFSIAAPSLGKHTYLASYAGDPQNLAASSPALIQEVDLRPTSTSISSSSTSLSAGDTVVLVSVVQATVGQGQNSHNPSGSVTFSSGSTVLGTGTAGPTGVVTITTTLPQGTYSVIASYSGDTLFAPSSSAPLTLTVGPTHEFQLTTNPTSLTLASGAHASMQLTLTSATSFADTLALGCAGLPVRSTCTFSDNQIKIAAGIPKQLTVTLDTGNPLGAGATASNRTSSSSPYLCALPFGALLALAFGRKTLRKRVRSLGLLSALFVLGLVATLTGCGTSFVQQATPAGSYSFQIVASGNTTGVTQTTTVQLTVTP